MIGLRHKAAQSAVVICVIVFLPAYASSESPPSGIHWAFGKPQRPSTPLISNTKWPRNDIDLFVLKQIEDSNLQPSVEAGARTLIRRLHFDLTGLPPTPAEIAGAGAPPRQEPTYTGHEPQVLTFLSGVQCVSRG